MRLTRREFLERAAIAAAAPWLLAAKSSASASAADAESSPGLAAAGPTAIKNFTRTLKGNVILPGDPNYDAARHIFSWNPLTAKGPAIIVRCVGTQDVANAIEFAHRHDLEVAVRGGGHDVLGQSLCNGMVIDLSAMKNIRVDSAQRTARAEAGLRSSDFNPAAQKFGLAAALGCNPMVGISGLTLGGGLGWLLGRFGAACDNLRSVEIVGADGRVLVASAEQNPDLFWALHGGGGNFGVATAFEFNLHPVSQVVGGFLRYPRERARSFYRFYRDYMRHAPDELVIETSLDAGGMTAMVCYSGDRTQSDRVLKPLLSFDRLLHGSLQPIRYIEFPPPPLAYMIANGLRAEWDAMVRFALGQPPAQPSIYWKGGYLSELSDSAIDMLVQASSEARGEWSIGLGHYMHGAICRIGETQTPLIRQPGGCSYFLNQGWHDPAQAADAIAWVDHWWQALQPFSKGMNYINYLSTGDAPAVAAAYGINYPRLVQIKTRYDPGNLFHLNRNIRPRPV